MKRVLKAMATAFWHSLRSRLSTFKLVSGVVMALLMSFVFYFFSCAMLEAFRLMTVTPEFDIWVPSEKERSFYQLFFAFVSVILAQSFCMAYWFDGPRRFFEQRHRWAVQIVNGQRNLNWYSDFKHLFILLIIVLFLHPWVAMRQAFKRKTVKWIALSAALVAVLAFGMSRINVVDYKSLDNAFLSRNVPHRYSLELPETDAVLKMQRASLSKIVYLVQDKDEPEPQCLVIVDGKIVGLEYHEIAHSFLWRFNLSAMG